MTLQLPEEARALAVQQLQTLTGCAKGLTRTSDILFTYDDSETAGELEKLQRARDDVRMIRLREGIIQGIQGVMFQWSTDAMTADVSH